MRHSWLPTLLAGFFLTATLCGAIVVQAQTPKAAPPAATAGKKSGTSMMKRLLAAINPTPDQITKLKAADTKSKKMVADIKANKTLTADQKKTLIKAEGKHLRDQAGAILTPAQREKWKTVMAQAAKERKAKMASAGGAKTAKK